MRGPAALAARPGRRLAAARRGPVLAAHLPGCPACQAELAELRTLFADLDALPAEVPPLALRDNFLAALAAEKATLAAAAPALGLTAQRGASPWLRPPSPPWRKPAP
ncbi:hypothetical protein, partial [Hymenobacter coccineus]|uniref:hypothetical protein n=1 Tax=Hymenobacter coccineus TaxID=1908235 RepID=UPI000B329457